MFASVQDVIGLQMDTDAHIVYFYRYLVPCVKYLELVRRLSHRPERAESMFVLFRNVRVFSVPIFLQMFLYMLVLS